MSTYQVKRKDKAASGPILLDLCVKDVTPTELIDILKKMQYEYDSLETERMNKLDSKYDEESMETMRERAIEPANWEKLDNVVLYAGDDDDKCARDCEMKTAVYHRLIGSKYFLCEGCFEESWLGKKLDPELITEDLENIYEYDFEIEDEDTDDEGEEDAEDEGEGEEDSEDE